MAARGGKHKWKVLAFYPDLGIKIRVTEYDSEKEMRDYVDGGCKIYETPYLVLKDNTPVEYKAYDLTPLQMAAMVERYL